MRNIKPTSIFFDRSATSGPGKFPPKYIFFNLLKCALRNQSFKAQSKAGNIFVGFFLQPGVKGCLEPAGFKPWSLRFPYKYARVRANILKNRGISIAKSRLQKFSIFNLNFYPYGAFFPPLCL